MTISPQLLDSFEASFLPLQVLGRDIATFQGLSSEPRGETAMQRHLFPEGR